MAYSCKFTRPNNYRLESSTKCDLCANGRHCITCACTTMYLNRLRELLLLDGSNYVYSLVVALIGSSIWMEWSDNVVSWELGISMIALASLSMWYHLEQIVE